jgi:hypothetical protein
MEFLDISLPSRLLNSFFGARKPFIKVQMDFFGRNNSGYFQKIKPLSLHSLLWAENQYLGIFPLT